MKSLENRGFFNASNIFEMEENMEKSGKKIVKFKKNSLQVWGMIILFVLLAYFLISFFLLLSVDPVVKYKIENGSLSEPNTFTGFILRQEEVVKSAGSGVINYYTREGEHVAGGDLVYSLDSTGKLAELLNNNTSEENSLSNEDLQDIRNTIIAFNKDFDTTSFRDVYDFKYDLQGTSLKLSNVLMLDNVQAVGGFSTSGVSLCYAPRSGYVVHTIDGYEDFTIQNITMDVFDQKDYTATDLLNEAQITPDQTVYKFITDENWQIVIPVTEEYGLELVEEQYVKVRFQKTGTVSNASTQMVQKGDEYFCVLSFNNSVVAFCGDRYADIEIYKEAEEGLKIPVTAIVNKEFFLIPKDFMAAVVNENGTFLFQKESYKEDGTLTTTAIELTVYSESDTEYYVSDPNLKIGDRLIKPNSQEQYTISKIGTLTGVYNINKGYADFRQITIIAQNDEYAIVKSNTVYGLRTYDYIVMDAESVKEDDLIFE